jgi:hypothetical protein
MFCDVEEMAEVFKEENLVIWQYIANKREANCW